MDIPALVDSLSYVGIFLLLTLNGVFSFPSSQITYIICGVLISKGTLSLVPTIIAGGLGNALGNLILFYIVYRYGTGVATTYFKIPLQSIISFHKKVERHGIWMLFIGKLTPSLKVIIPFVAGLARIKTSIAILLFTSTSLIWAAAFVSLGYFFGEHFSWKNYVLIMALVGFGIAFIFYKKIIEPKD